MLGLHEKGFDVKRLDQLIDELKQEFKKVFGDNFNCEPSTPQGQIIGIVSDDNADLYELAEQAYNSFNPDVSSGTTLDNLVTLNGISRLPATKAQVDLIFIGANNARVPAGTMVSDGNIKFVTTEFGTVKNNSLTLKAESVEEGAIFASANTLTILENPITNIDSVYNPEDSLIGTEKETDDQLRARRVKSFSLAGMNSIDSIRSAILSVNGVESVSIVENDTTADTSIPRNSFKCIVKGASDDLVAQAIFSKKPVGITTTGNTTVAVKDSEGFESIINFTRPVEKDLYIKMTLNTNLNYQGDDLVKEELIKYSANLIVGQDVIFSRLFTPINNVKGHEITSLEISLDGVNYVSSTIAIDDEEIAILKEANIEIN